MKAALKLGLSLAVVLSFLALAQAEDKKEEKLKGTITCAKCDLGESAKCHTVVKVKDKLYWFDTASNGKYHKDTCKKAKEGTVTGTVSTKDGKSFVKVSKVEYAK
jgi:hypothetical protein